MLCASENGSPGLFDFFYMRIIVQCCPRFWKGTSAVSVLSFDWRKHKSAVWWGDSPVWVSIMWPVAVITDYRVNKFFFYKKMYDGPEQVAVITKCAFYRGGHTESQLQLTLVSKCHQLINTYRLPFTENKISEFTSS